MDKGTTAILVAGGVIVSGIYIFKDEIANLFKPENKHDKNVDAAIEVISGHKDELTEEELETVTEGTKDELRKERDAGIITEEEYEEKVLYIDTYGLLDIATVMDRIDDIDRRHDELYAGDILTQEDLDELEEKWYAAHLPANILSGTISYIRKENKESNNPSWIAEYLDSFVNTINGHKLLAAASCATVAAMIIWLKRGRPGSGWLIEKIRSLTQPDDPLDTDKWDTRPMPTFSYTYSHPRTDNDFNPEPIIGGVSINPEITVTTYPDPLSIEVNIPEDTPELTDEQHNRWLRFKELFETVFEPGETTQAVYPLIEPYLPDQYQNLIDPDNPPDAITFVGNFLPDDIKYNYGEDDQIKWFVNNGMWWMVDSFVIAVIGILAAIIVIAAIIAPEVVAAVATFTSRIAPYAVFAA